jgi:hypothetical protein
MRWELGELFRNLIETQSDSLGKHDERDAPQNFPRKSSLPSTFAFGANQSALFVKAKRRRGNSTPLCHISDSQQPGHI